MRKFKGTKDLKVRINSDGYADGVKSNGKLIVTVWSPRSEDDEILNGESWLSMRNRTKQDRIDIKEEMDANAKLIAAAPELLEALINLVNQIENEHVSEFMDEFSEQADKAIIKALGHE